MRTVDGPDPRVQQPANQLQPPPSNRCRVAIVHAGHASSCCRRPGREQEDVGAGIRAVLQACMSGAGGPSRGSQCGIRSPECGIRSPARSPTPEPGDSRSRRRTRSLAASASAPPRSFLMLPLLLVWLLAMPTTAVMVPFRNCLPDSYVYNTPALLQWAPLYVDASFDTQSPSHQLRLTMWGNVTGSFSNSTLPPANSSKWSDPSYTDGKIVDEPDPNSDKPKLTTLHNKINFLSYEPWTDDANFCAESLTNASCPLGPVFNTSELSLPYHLPSVNLSHDLFSSFAFTSLTATFIIIYGDTPGTNIGCVSATVTPDLGSLKWMLKVFPIVILLMVGVATIFAGIFSPWGTADVFHWSSNYGRDPNLLRVVTPGFADCLQYIQFVALTGGLSLSYPGFYRPMASQGAWSALMYNQSFVSHGTGMQTLVDGIYVTNGTYGMQHLAQLVGMREAKDIWAGMMVWLLVIIAAVFVIVQVGFLLQWTYRHLRNVREEDLRAKNIPFSVGNVIRIVFNCFLFPIVALSTFQLVVAGSSPAYTVVLAVVALVTIIGFTAWLLRLVGTTKPRAFLFDDLPTLLMYGPLYNTYSDEAAAYALIPVLLTFIRGIAVGAVQPSGVAQLVILAICEIIHILTLHAFRPFYRATSMNAYHTLFSSLRLTTVLLMIAFVPSLGVAEGTKGWVGYAVLLIHAGVLLLGFLLNALQKIVEVMALMMGAGLDEQGRPRGGLHTIFGMRQLAHRSRRVRDVGPSRQSQLSTSGMLDADEVSKAGYIMRSGRVRSESAGSMGAFTNHRHTSSSIMDASIFDGPIRNAEGGPGSFTPTTPGEASSYTLLPSPGGVQRHSAAGQPTQAAGPYYRPPRARRKTLDQSSLTGDRDHMSGAMGDSARGPGAPGGIAGEASDIEAQLERGGTPGPFAPAAIISPTPRTDYSTREVDFYYGVRGERLNSDAPNRKLGTGPADPTGPMASAAAWVRTFLGGKTKEKGKGFEVVRSARMPPAMRAGGGEYGDDSAPQGIPVAMGALRNGPIESDDEDEVRGKKGGRHAPADQPGGAELLDVDGSPRIDDEADESEVEERVPEAAPVLPDIDRGDSLRIPSRIQSKASRRTAVAGAVCDDDLLPVPPVPRKSSKRDSGGTPQPSRPTSLVVLSSGGEESRDQAAVGSRNVASRLPFERTTSQKRMSSASSMSVLDNFTDVDLSNATDAQDERRTSYGYVAQGNISRVDPDVDLLSSSGEVVDVRK